jgi:hypothetical protein
MGMARNSGDRRRRHAESQAELFGEQLVRRRRKGCGKPMDVPASITDDFCRSCRVNINLNYDHDLPPW